MKLLKWFVLFSLLAPFLVCDPDLAFQGIRVQFDGGAWIEGTILTNAQGVYLHHDLASLAVGNHTVKAKSYNVWGESVETAPFTFQKALPGVPATLKVSP